MDAFIPFSSNLAEDPRDQCYIRVIGRLRKGATIPQAQAELESIAAQLRAEFTVFAEQALGLQVVPLHGDVVRNVRAGAPDALRRREPGFADRVRQRRESS